MRSATRKHFKQRRPALFWFVGKGGVMLVSGMLMVLIAGLSDIKLAHDFDPHHGALAARMRCLLVHISDGDTVVAQCDGARLKIRLAGIDTPEMGQKPWGERSKAALRQRLTQTFVVETQGYDVYQRVIGVIYVDGRDINLSMLQSGDAVVYDAAGTPSEYYQAEQTAKAAKLGIWAKKGDQQNPQRWRRYHL